MGGGPGGLTRARLLQMNGADVKVYERDLRKAAQMVFDGDANERGDVSRPEIDRGPRQQILLDALKPGTVVWGSHFVALSEENGAWKIEFKDGAFAVADLVIAADGANAKIRPYITPIQPFTRVLRWLRELFMILKKRSPGIHKLLNRRKIFAMVAGITLESIVALHTPEALAYLLDIVG